MSLPSYHEPVLCREAVGFLITDLSGVYVDATAGGGGHAHAICSLLGAGGRLICFDADEDALRSSRERLRQFGENVTFVHSNFGSLATEMQCLGITRISGLLLDLGVSSYQLDEPSKGFSFRADAPLDMRFDRRQDLSAREVLNAYSEESLRAILRDFGEEHAYRRIVRSIMSRRPLATTGELAAAVEDGAGKRYLTKSLARVFQALRIEVNHELENLRRVLAAGVAMLNAGGRVVAISYHSLEDRVVKEFLRDAAAPEVPSGHRLIPGIRKEPLVKVLTKKPVLPSDDEVRRNGRARSAKMRVAERLERAGG